MKDKKNKKKLKPLKISRYRKAVAAGELTDPLIYMDAVMCGEDLHNKSKLYELALQVDSDEGPDVEQWEEIQRLILRHFRYDTVKVADSLRAAERLAEYIHPKVKTEEGGASSRKGAGEVKPLTDDEIERFREKWNDDY